MKRRLWGIFALGGLQGVVGWWMVASGLSERVEVSQYRLATHLVLALLIYTAIVWTLRRLSDRPSLSATVRLKATSVVLLVVTFVQLYLGALVAGLRAGKIYNTWPDIDGGFIPSSARLFFEQPWWRKSVRQYHSPCNSNIAWSPIRCLYWRSCTPSMQYVRVPMPP